MFKKINDSREIDNCENLKSDKKLQLDLGGIAP